MTRDELRREEYEADFPICRAHRIRGCEPCEDEADESEHDVDDDRCKCGEARSSHRGYSLRNRTGGLGHSFAEEDADEVG